MEKTNGKPLPVQLSPSQQQAYDSLLAILPKGKLIGLACKSGCGRTTILQNLADTLNARFLRLSDVFERYIPYRQLEVDIIVPFERDDLARELGLSPKRGVLLYGPPGTGKTTIGRALAHRLRSKFFLIDGTVISGTQQFYGAIQHIFAQARENAPSILFIDDCDLLFENEEETGLYRYLLTMLDGLESKGNSLVTVILTAMNIGSLPPALVRSGRVELWLEMKLPKTDARREILRTHLMGHPLSLKESELKELAGRTEGMTGADLRRIVADARNLYGYDVAKEQGQLLAYAYFEKAIQQLEKHREQLAAAPAYTAAHHPGASTKGLVKPVTGM